MAPSSPAFMLTPQPTPKPTPDPRVASSATIRLEDQYGETKPVTPSPVLRQSTTGATTATPRPSSPAVSPSTPPRRKSNVAVIAAGAVAVLAVVGVGVSMTRKPAESASAGLVPPSSATTLEAPKTALEAPKPTAEPVATEAVPDANAPVTAENADANAPAQAGAAVPAAVTGGAAQAAHANVAGSNGKRPVATAAAASSAKAGAASAAAAAPATPAAPAATPTNAIDGRSIRTGL
jgi:hypothetical protein